MIYCYNIPNIPIQPESSRFIQETNCTLLKMKVELNKHEEKICSIQTPTTLKQVKKIDDLKKIELNLINITITFNRLKSTENVEMSPHYNEVLKQLKNLLAPTLI